jgi:hypothetical protein
MPGVPKKLIEHSINVYPQAVPKKQRLRRFAPDKREAIIWEIAKLLVAGFIKEVIHPEWVANPVLVLKKNKEWRMRVDYTDLNKHCPKDQAVERLALQDGQLGRVCCGVGNEAIVQYCLNTI